MSLTNSFSCDLVTLLEAKPYEPQVKPLWWNKKHHCAYHRNRGYLTNNYLALKGVIQKLIDDKIIEVNSLCTNEDHAAFKTPFMSHEKGESSKVNQNKLTNKKVNYAHNYDNTINMLSSFDNTINVIVIQEKHKKQPLNAITQGQASKVVLLGVTTNLDQATTSSNTAKYSLVNQLLKTLAHISIFEFL